MKGVKRRMETEILIHTCHYRRPTGERIRMSFVGEMEDFAFFIRHIHFGFYLPTFSKCLSWQEDEKTCFQVNKGNLL